MIMNKEVFHYQYFTFMDLSAVAGPVYFLHITKLCSYVCCWLVYYFLEWLFTPKILTAA